MVGRSIDLSAANNLPARGDELMRIIARFEFALKEIGIARVGHGGAVEPNWDEFANDKLKSDFFVFVRDSGIAPTILSRPPSRQILQHHSLAWQASEPPTNVQSLLGAVRRVRNNLVHGGKSGDEDFARNDLLIEEAISVLLESLSSSPELLSAFEGRW